MYIGAAEYNKVEAFAVQAKCITSHNNHRFAKICKPHKLALSSKPLHEPGCKPDNWLDNKASWLAEHWLTSPGAAASAWQLAGTGWQVPKLVAS